jgi:hypothetical protein
MDLTWVGAAREKDELEESESIETTEVETGEMERSFAAQEMICGGVMISKSKGGATMSHHVIPFNNHNASVTHHVKRDKETTLYSDNIEFVENPNFVTFTVRYSGALIPSNYQIRVSSSKSELPSRPMHALRNVSSALRWRESEFTTSEPARNRVSIIRLKEDR